VTEARLIEFVRTPRLERRNLALSQSDAWIELAERRSKRFAVLLRRLMRSTEDAIASEAGEYLAWMGFEEDHGRVIRGLRSGSWRMREKIASGVVIAKHRRWLSRAFQAKVWREMEAFVTGERGYASGLGVRDAVLGMINSMLELDRRAGMRLLKGNRAIRAGNLALGEVIGELASQQEYYPDRFGREVDPGLLWPVFEALKSGRVRLLPWGAMKQPERKLETMAQILRLASDRDPVRTKREANRLLKLGVSDGVRSELRVALRRCKGVPEVDALVQVFYKRPRSFGKNASLALRAAELREHVLGDGLDGYFSNMGRNWKEAAAGMRLVGATAAAGILTRAAKVVSEYGSLKDNRSALDASIAMEEAGDTRLKKLEDAMWEELDRVHAGVERYIAGHVEEFTTRRSRSARS
jgi:hypothetical protein